ASTRCETGTPAQALGPTLARLGGVAKRASKRSSECSNTAESREENCWSLAILEKVDRSSRTVIWRFGFVV
ncbi:MAG: hypothetical protein NWP69_00355, partial [Congregibacter sp.]|nr:hypothetical protein [Congregibacter sp.]